MIKKAIANYINARAEKIRPCEHDWELLTKGNFSNGMSNVNYSWTEWVYRCKKCGARNFIKSD